MISKFLAFIIVGILLLLLCLLPKINHLIRFDSNVLCQYLRWYYIWEFFYTVPCFSHVKTEFKPNGFDLQWDDKIIIFKCIEKTVKINALLLTYLSFVYFFKTIWLSQLRWMASVWLISFPFSLLFFAWWLIRWGSHEHGWQTKRSPKTCVRWTQRNQCVILIWCVLNAQFSKFNDTTRIRH